MDIDSGVWDLDELNAVDMQLASTPKAKKLSQRKKRGSLMERIENQTPSKVETSTNAGYENRSSSIVVDSDDEEMLRSLSIFLLDGSQHQLRVLPTTTVAQCIVMLREILALQNDSHFALFEVKNGLLRGLVEVIPENEKILGYTQSWKTTQTDPALLDNGALDGAVPGGSRHIVFKQRLYLPWSPIHTEAENATSVTSAAHMLEYIDSVHKVMCSSYSCDKTQLMELAGYMIQAELGDFDPEKVFDVSYVFKKKMMQKLTYVLPAYFRQNRKMSKYNDRLIKLWKNSSGMSPLQCQKQYIGKLKEWLPYYGCEFYPCNYKRSDPSKETRGEMLNGVLLGVGHDGIYVLRRASRKEAKIKPFKVLVVHRYLSIMNFSVSTSGMVLSFQIGPKDQGYVVTPQAREIHELFSMYIQHVINQAEASGSIAGGSQNFNDETKEDGAISSVVETGTLKTETFAAEIPAGWEEHEDDNTGKKFFYNSKRRVSVWSAEEITKLEMEAYGESIGEDSPWVPITDTNTGQTYYYNKLTGETSWTRGNDNEKIDTKLMQPKNDENAVEGTDENVTVKHDNVSEWREVQDNEGRVYYVNSNGESTWQNPFLENDGVDSDSDTELYWTKEYDENSGLHYYVSSETGESQWAVPSDGNIQIGNTARSPTTDREALVEANTPQRRKSGRRASLFEMKLEEIGNKDHQDLLDGF